jgi:hypothetical protein
VAGLLLLLACGLVGAVSYAIYSAANAVNKVVDNVNTVAMDFPGAQPKDLNEALQWLAAGGMKAENAAAWLEKRPPDPARRAEVLAALDRDYTSATVNVFARQTYLNAMAAWAGPNDVPILVHSLDVAVNDKVLDALVRYKNDEAARGVAKHLDSDMFKASDTLKRMGPVAEDAVADFLLAAPNGTTPKWEALRILKVIGTRKTVPKVQEALRNDKAIDYDANQAIAAMQKR